MFAVVEAESDHVGLGCKPLVGSALGPNLLYCTANAIELSITENKFT
jgi:hypothetical protein